MYETVTRPILLNGLTQKLINAVNFPCQADTKEERRSLSGEENLLELLISE